MRVRNIYYGSGFARYFKKLDKVTQIKAKKAEALLRSDPFHPSLRLHKLKVKLAAHWSISVDMRVRILFLRLADGDVMFVTIGGHEVY